MRLITENSDQTPSRVHPAELHGVCVTLGGVLVLNMVDAHVAAGESVALMGANGSGKSTFIRALLGLAPAEGDIRLFGTPRARFRDWSRIGYVPQRSAGSLGIATVREVVTSGLLPGRTPLLPINRTQRARVDEALERVGLAHRGRDEMSTLSGGQQQRVLIARALVGHPELMILDEPMAGVDMETQHQLTDVLAGLKRDGLAMLVVLHELGPLNDLMDRAIVLREGRVIHDGEPMHAGHGHEHIDEVGPASLIDDPFTESLL